MSGELPPGVVAVNSLLALKFIGSPQVVGIFNSTYQVTDYLSGRFVASFITRVILPPRLVVSEVASLGELGVRYFAQLSHDGGFSPLYIFGTHEFTPLPLGLLLNASTIVGTPLEAGVFDLLFTVQAAFIPTPGSEPVFTGGRVVAQTHVRITIHPPLFVLHVSTSNAVEVGSTYESRVLASGGLSPFRYFVANGTLPLGLQIDPSSGSVFGRASGLAGSFSLTFGVTDSLQARSFVESVIVVTEASSSLSQGAVAGIILASLVGVAAFVLFSIMLYRKWNSSIVTVDEGNIPYQLMESDRYKF